MKKSLVILSLALTKINPVFSKDINLGNEKTKETLNKDLKVSNYDNFISIIQKNDNNNLIISQSGTENSILVEQYGNSNAILHQNGINNTIQLTQTGNNNHAIVNQH